MEQELDAFCRQRRSLFYPKADLPFTDALLRTLASKDSLEDLPAPVLFDLCAHALGEKPMRVCTLEASGTFHHLYRVYLPRRRTAILRASALSPWQVDLQLHLDRWAQEVMRSHGLPALTVHHVDTSRRFCDFDYQILEEARGQPLTVFDHDDARLLPLLSRLGSLVAELHQVPTDRYGFLDVGPLLSNPKPEKAVGLCRSWRRYLLTHLQDHVRTCVDIKAMTPREARTAGKLFELATELFVGFRPSLLHGDMGSHNVFSDGTTITALIDWEDCLSGDSVFEIAFWATFHPERRHAAFLDGYRAVTELPDDFEARFWLYYLRIALSKTVLRQRLGIADRPGRPPASQRIQKGLQRAEAALGGARHGVAA
jgi:aminoglycoside phosphotransferase (APT) family kinase protein